jgi:type VI secretion system protein ImpC
MTDEPLPPDLDVVDRYPDGLKVTTDRPYRILLITDLAGDEDGRLRGPLTERVVDVTPENFDALLAEAQPTVALKLADPLSPTNALTALELSFRTLKDFTPPAMLQQIPSLRGVLDAREQIVARLRGKLSAAQFVAALQKLAAVDPQLKWVVDSTHWTPSAAPPPDSVVDDVLGQLDLGEQPGGPPAPPRKSPLGAVVAAAAGGGALQIPAEESSALRRTLTQIDQRLTAWLNAVLHAAPLQRVESGWRSLALLVSRFDFRKGVRLAVLHARRDELTQRLVALVVDPVFDAGADAPDLIVVHESFGNTAPEIEVLDELAQHAASLPVVALAGASAEFFGLKHAWQVPSLPPLVSMFDQWQFAKWKTLREQPYARALGLVFGRCLLRAPYAATAGDDLAFQYREECIAEKDSLWTNGAVAAACTIAHGMADVGWPTGIVGRLEGFPVARGGKKGEKQLGPADTVMPLEKGQEMAMVGLNAVLCPPNQTDACVCGGFSAARPTRAEGLALLEVSLPYQLFASRLSTLLLELKPHLTGLSDEKLAAFVLTHVRDWLTVADVAPEEQQIAVQAKPLEDNPNSLQLAVTVTPPPQILPGGVPVVLGYRVR